MLTMLNKTTVHLHYASIGDLVADCKAPCKTESNTARAVNFLTATNRGRDWYGIEGGAPAVAACLQAGYPEGQATMQRILDAMRPHLPRAIGHNRSRVRGSFGDELDIHAVNRGGIDKAWSTMSRRLKQGTGIVRLCVDVGGNSSQSAQRLTWRGIAGVALSTVLEKAGYSVELVGCFAVQGITARSRTTRRGIVSYVAKSRQARADVGFLSAVLSLPGFFRTFGFAQIVRAADSFGKPVDGTLGRYLDVSGVLPVPEKVTQIMVPSSCIDEDSVIDWIKGTIGLLQAAHSNEGAR